MTHHNICDECETVAHCSNHGCIPKHQALDKMAENARELGLDYDPTQIDWEAIAADQAMTIALLKAEQPAQQKPLTPEWIWTWLMDWCKRNGSSPANYNSLFKMVADARAIEAAHGIKE